MQELQQKLFRWLCIWLSGAFSGLLTLCSAKIVKIDFFYKRGLVFYKIGWKWEFFSKEVSQEIKKNEDPCQTLDSTWMKDFLGNLTSQTDVLGTQLILISSWSLISWFWHRLSSRGDLNCQLQKARRIDKITFTITLRRQQKLNKARDKLENQDIRWMC